MERRTGPLCVNSKVATKQAMSKEETFQDLSLNPPSGKQELWRWLYTELRGAILDGRLKPGARMPSTRSLGMQYSLSRGTVVAAFDQLQAEGYTRTEVGSGTYVASGVPDGFLSATRKPAALALPTSKAALSKRAQQFLKDVEVTACISLHRQSFPRLRTGHRSLPRGPLGACCFARLTPSSALALWSRQCCRLPTPSSRHRGVRRRVTRSALLCRTDHRHLRHTTGPRPHRSFPPRRRRSGLDGRPWLFRRSSNTPRHKCAYRSSTCRRRWPHREGRPQACAQSKARLRHASESISDGRHHVRGPPLGTPSLGRRRERMDHRRRLRRGVPLLRSPCCRSASDSTVPVASSTSAPSRRCSSTRCVSASWSCPSVS